MTAGAKAVRVASTQEVDFNMIALSKNLLSLQTEISTTFKNAENISQRYNNC
ncbi:hypothetical protein VB735_30760 [Halotia wernerae UHCC 0503]|nr:hypothetical protein [Halotia wernerae UHCC 0503]